MTKSSLMIWLMLATGCVFGAQATEHPAATSKDSGAPAGGIVDGSFELGTPNPFWNEASLMFGVAICNAMACGTGAGTSVPRSGSSWVWFGGAAGLGEIGSVDQDLVLPTSESNITFYLWNGSADAAGSDYFEAGVDGQVLFSITENDPDYGAGYTRVDMDISNFADGDTHSLFFRGTDLAGENTSFALDDVGLGAQRAGATAIIPSLSPAGLILLGLLFAASGLVSCRQRRQLR